MKTSPRSARRGDLFWRKSTVKQIRYLLREEESCGIADLILAFSHRFRENNIFNLGFGAPPLVVVSSENG